MRIALSLKNIEYKYSPVHLLNNGGEQFSPTYKALNPMSEVPTLEHDGLIIGQAVAIIEYLEGQFPNPNLFPRDSQKRAKIGQFCENINSFLHPLSNLKVLKYLEDNHGYDQRQKEVWINHWYQKGLNALEAWLQKNMGKYSFADQVTVADCFLVPMVFTSERFNVDLSPFKNIMSVNSRCLELDAFKPARRRIKLGTAPLQPNFAGAKQAGVSGVETSPHPLPPVEGTAAAPVAAVVYPQPAAGFAVAEGEDLPRRGSVAPRLTGALEYLGLRLGKLPRTCASCSNPLPPNPRFCPHCGEAAGQNSAPCGNCGSTRPLNARFCPRCGAAAAATPVVS